MSKAAIYLSDTDFCLDQQLAHFIKNDHCFSAFITPLADKLNTQYIKSQKGFCVNFCGNTLEYLDVLVNKVTEILNATQASEIEIHFPVTINNLTYIAHGLIRNLYANHAVTLHIYDSSIFDVLNRINFIRLEKETQTNITFSRLTDELVIYLQNSHVSFSPRVDSIYLPYCWHAILPTRYHLVCYDFIKTNISCLESILPHIDEIKFSYLFELSNKEFVSWLKARNINLSMMQMQKYSSKKTLFIDLPFPLSMIAEKKYVHDTYMQLRGEKIAVALDELLQDEMLAQFDTIIIKPNHKGDTEYTSQFVDVLSAQGKCVEVNNDININLLNRLAGSISIASGCNLYMLLTDQDNIKMIFMNENQEYASTKALMNLIQKMEICGQAPVYYLNETRQLSLAPDDEITISMSSSLGDCMFALACMQQVKETFNKKITFLTHKAYAPIAKCCPWVDSVRSMQEQGDVNLYFYRQEELGRKIVLCDTLDTVSSVHQIESCVRKMGILPDPKKLDMTLNLQAYDFSSVDDFILQHTTQDKNIVLLHANIGDPNRTWSDENWNDLANNFINDGWQVISIGSSNNKYKETQMHRFTNNNIIDAVDKFSILETIYLMRKCQLLVATDSGPVALAGATDIAIVAMYTIVPGSKRIAYRHGSLGWNAMCVNLKCQYGHCMTLSIDDDFCKKKMNSNIQMGRLNTWCPYGDIAGDKYRYNCIKSYPAHNLYVDIKKFIRSKRFYLQK